MYLNVYQAQLVAEERVKDAMRRAEQARLIRAAKGPRKAREWRLPVALSLSSLLALFTRSQAGSAEKTVETVGVPSCC